MVVVVISYELVVIITRYGYAGGMLLVHLFGY